MLAFATDTEYPWKPYFFKNKRLGVMGFRPLGIPAPKGLSFLSLYISFFLSIYLI